MGLDNPEVYASLTPCLLSSVGELKYSECRPIAISGHSCMHMCIRASQRKSQSSTFSCLQHTWTVKFVSGAWHLQRPA